MGKEINIDFDTLFWSFNSWISMYLYITNFKSRIYKATRQKLYQKKDFLQKRLLFSPTAKICASLMIINTDLENKGGLDWYNDQNQYNKNKDSLSLALEFYLFSKKKQDKYRNNLHTPNSLLVILILFVLEPEFSAKQDQGINIVNIYSPQFAIRYIRSLIQNQEQRLCLENISMIPYFTSLSLKYITTKLHLSNSLSCIFKSQVQNFLNVDIINTSHLQRLLKFNSLRNQINNIILKFFTYLLISETSYISSSFGLCPKLQNEQYTPHITVLNYGYEILICHKSKVYLELWEQVFDQTINLNKVNQANNIINARYSYNTFNFLGYSFFLENNTLVAVEPGKDAQILLFRKINLLFLKLKSNSTISLINSLNHLLKEWGSYFIETRARKVFAVVDYLIYLKIRSWILRNHPSWGKLKIMSKYFLVEAKYLHSRIEHTHRVFYAKNIVNEKQVNCTLIRLKDLNAYN